MSWQHICVMTTFHEHEIPAPNLFPILHDIHPCQNSCYIPVISTGARGAFPTHDVGVAPIG